MKSNTIPVYCFNWHLHQSPAQREILIDPLSPYIQFDVNAWDGVHLDLSRDKMEASPLVFFFFPPPPQLFAFPTARLIWVPMWDDVQRYNDKWWQELPKTLRIVAFSEQVYLKARSVGLRALKIKYYRNPGNLEPAQWNGKNTLFYWNRTGLVSREFLRKTCKALDVEVLLFRRRIDPGWPSWCDYGLPHKLGNTAVKELAFDGAEGYQQYWKYLNQANIFIAPRQSEGVGLSFIEALAKGCAVFAYDAPTMNEYIAHKKNGYLLTAIHGSKLNSLGQKIYQRINDASFQLGLMRSKVLHPILQHPVSTRQNWTEIAGMDLQSLGSSARQDQFEGYKMWMESIPRFASFILDW
jgi:hypothetical protein